MKKTTLLFFLVMLFLSKLTIGQINPEVVLPNYNDSYSTTIQKLEKGQTDIDYKEFRESFIESEQFKIASARKTEFDSLKKEMYSLMDKGKSLELIKITKQMLSIDYTSMIAHKILRQTYSIVGDTLNAKKYKDIQFGLLNSIVKNGDGKSCKTGWSVIQVTEEYFILQMLGASLQAQSINNDDGICDKMEVTIDGAAKTYYFEISKVFEGYNKLRGK